MTRRAFFLWIAAGLAWLINPWRLSVQAADAAGGTAPGAAPVASSGQASGKMNAALYERWLASWEEAILVQSRNRYCDKETGEEIGWLISPFLSGYYYGYMATQNPRWVDLFVDWTDAWIRRGIVEPDGYLGWPKLAGASTQSVPDWYTDNLLGEAMGLRPVVLMADTILKTPALKSKYGQQAERYLRISEQIFEKWDQRGCWREVKDGGLWVVPPFGINSQTGKWTEGYDLRYTGGFSNPSNKQNLIAVWLMAMSDATGRTVYRERAEKWWQLMKSRMRLRESGKYYVWNYWDPAGPWDYRPDGKTQHWLGVHPNGEYYNIDVRGVVNAFEHGLVFTRKEIDRLIATNRDFMWNGQIEGATFQRIDGGQPDDRWKNSGGTLWLALTPYDEILRKIFEANHNPTDWGSMSAIPWYVARQTGKLIPGR